MQSNYDESEGKNGEQAPLVARVRDVRSRPATLLGDPRADYRMRTLSRLE